MYELTALLSPLTAAELLQLSKAEFAKLITDGEIDIIKHAGQNMVSTAAVLELVDGITAAEEAIAPLPVAAIAPVKATAPGIEYAVVFSHLTDAKRVGAEIARGEGNSPELALTNALTALAQADAEMHARLQGAEAAKLLTKDIKQAFRYAAPPRSSKGHHAVGYNLTVLDGDLHALARVQRKE